MRNTVRRPKILVSADGAGIVSHAGALLLTETARVTGLQAGLPARAGHADVEENLRVPPPDCVC